MSKTKYSDLLEITQTLLSQSAANFDLGKLLIIFFYHARFNYTFISMSVAFDITENAKISAFVTLETR